MQIVKPCCFGGDQVGIIRPFADMLMAATWIAVSVLLPITELIHIIALMRPSKTKNKYSEDLKAV